MTSKYPPPKVIAVDVDGTLHRHGQPNKAVIAWCRAKQAAGYSLMLWSSRGEAHARKVATAFGCAELFAHIVSKPGYILDDKGWKWTRFTRVVRALNEVSEVRTEPSLSQSCDT